MQIEFYFHLWLYDKFRYYEERLLAGLNPGRKGRNKSFLFSISGDLERKSVRYTWLCRFIMNTFMEFDYII